jgi:hypothetical protein
VQDALCNVAVVSAFRQPVLERLTVEFVRPVCVFYVSKVESGRDFVLGKDFSYLVLLAQVHVPVKKVQSFVAVSWPPVSLFGQEQQDPLQHVATNA